MMQPAGGAQLDRQQFCYDHLSPDRHLTLIRSSRPRSAESMNFRLSMLVCMLPSRQPGVAAD